MIRCPSPNFDDRPEGRTPDMLILHYTGLPSLAESIARLCDAAAKVSCHYLIDEEGGVYALVDEDKRAWHAGVAFWAGERDINGCSIGIELQNPGHEFGYRAFPEPQMAALEDLAGDLVTRYAIAPSRVLAHSDVAPMRKTDPGELFDWARLAAAGIGRWCETVDPEGDDIAPLKPGDTGQTVRELQDELARFGYGIEATGDYDVQTHAVVAAFQRHFRPSKVDGIADAATRACLRYFAGS